MLGGTLGCPMTRLPLREGARSSRSSQCRSAPVMCWTRFFPVMNSPSAFVYDRVCTWMDKQRS